MRTLAATGVAILLAAYLAIPAVAQEVTCDNIAFDEQATLSYPAIRDACLEIIESEGARYAHFKLRVHREGYPSLMVRYQHRDGAWGPATLLTPPEGFKVNLDGRQVAVNDVPRGRELSIYLPEGRWEIAMTDADQLVIAEAEFAPVEFEVTAEELPEEVDMDAPAMAVAVDEAEADRRRPQLEHDPRPRGGLHHRVVPAAAAEGPAHGLTFIGLQEESRRRGPAARSPLYIGIR